MSDRSAEIARIIWQQLGGNRFAAMTGAKNLVHGKGQRPGEVASLTFKVMRNAHKTTHVRVTLKGDDTYRMEFLHWNAKRMEFRLGLLVDTVYADGLHNAFHTGTGLQTSLAA